MARNEQHGIITEITDLTPSVRELTIRPEAPFSFQAGQFVMLQVPNSPKPTPRAYSIASCALQSDTYKLVIKHFEGGLASEWVKGLKGGEKIVFTGPFGKFLLRQPVAPQLVMVCTSTGVAPLYSMLASLKDVPANTLVKFYMGVWNEKEMFYGDRLEELKKRLPGFEYHFVLDAAESTWKGFKGRVTEPLSNLNFKISTDFYLCGNPNMIKSVKELLESNQVPKEKVFTESYG